MSLRAHSRLPLLPALRQPLACVRRSGHGGVPCVLLLALMLLAAQVLVARHAPSHAGDVAGQVAPLTVIPGVQPHADYDDAGSVAGHGLFCELCSAGLLAPVSATLPLLRPVQAARSFRQAVALSPAALPSAYRSRAPPAA